MQEDAVPSAGRSERVRRDQAGFALLEIVIAVMIAGVVVAALTRGLAAALDGARSARATAQATGLARSALESARGLGWPGLGHAEGSLSQDPLIAGGTFDPDGPGPLPAEPVVEGNEGLLASSATQETLGATTYRVGTYVTDPGGDLKRVTAVVEWSESGRTRRSTTSTLVPAGRQDIAAAAFVVGGALAGTSLGQVAPAQAAKTGGSASDEVASFAVPSGGAVPVVTGSGAASSAIVASGPSAYAEASFSSISIAAGGVTIAASGVRARASSSPGSMTVGASGTVTINGIPYANPAPGTRLSIGGIRVVLNDQRRESDGSVSVTFIRVETPDSEMRVGWAWVKPAEFLDV